MESHLLQMRGLKQRSGVYHPGRRTSHLLQMRGLKQPCKWHEPTFPTVASFTDAWIETRTVARCKCENGSHLLQMRGLKPRLNTS